MAPAVEGLHGVAPGQVHCGTGPAGGAQVATPSASARQYQQVAALQDVDDQARPVAGVDPHARVGAGLLDERLHRVPSLAAVVERRVAPLEIDLRGAARVDALD